jgi:hypothetical protein
MTSPGGLPQQAVATERQQAAAVHVSAPLDTEDLLASHIPHLTDDLDQGQKQGDNNDRKDHGQ